MGVIARNKVQPPLEEGPRSASGAERRCYGGVLRAAVHRWAGPFPRTGGSLRAGRIMLMLVRRVKAERRSPLLARRDAPGSAEAIARGSTSS